MNGKLRKKIFVYWHGLGHTRCPYCHCQLVWNNGQKNSASIEHIIPTSVGGTNQKENIIVTCHSCNNRRGNLEFLLWIKDLPLEKWLASKHSSAIEKYNNNPDRKRFHIKSSKSIKIWSFCDS